MLVSIRLRIGITWQNYQARQDLLVEHPERALTYGIRHIAMLQEWYGDCMGCVVHDYKGGAFSHLDAQVQMMLRDVDPNLIMDGDLLRFDPVKGTPLKDVSATETVAQRFNKKYQLGFSDDEIRDALAQQGKKLTQDCFIREMAKKATKGNPKKLPETTLDTQKDETSSSPKDQETVGTYVTRVIKKYESWEKALSSKIPKNQPNPTKPDSGLAKTTPKTPPSPTTQPQSHTNKIVSANKPNSQKKAGASTKPTASLSKSTPSKKALSLQEKAKKREPLMASLKTRFNGKPIEITYGGLPNTISIIFEIGLSRSWFNYAIVITDSGAFELWDEKNVKLTQTTSSAEIGRLIQKKIDSNPLNPTPRKSFEPLIAPSPDRLSPGEIHVLP